MTIPMAMLTDTTRCVGCEKCVEACKKENGLPPDRPRRWKLRIDDLSSTRFTTLARRAGNRFVRKHCRHCLEPACASACIVGALRKTPEGPVIYDSDKCMGCRYCMVACPYAIPRYQWENAIPYVRKCTMCFPRISQGQAPACVEACEQKATVYGSREDLLAQAHQRILSHPGKYADHVFGEVEVGGTSVLTISDISLSFLGNSPELGTRPLPELTWVALSKVPPLVLGVSTLMAGVFWITGRRVKLAREAQEASPQEVNPQDNPGPQDHSQEKKR